MNFVERSGGIDMAEPYEMLIVDDERIEREGIKSLIRKYQLPFHVAEACDGSAAKEFLQSHPVDVVFTDIVMPLCNGVELARWIRTAMPESITVIYSAYGEFEYAQKALEARVLKYVLKPLCPERFRAEMEEVALLCEQRRSRRREQEQWQRRKRRSALLRALYAPAEAPLPSWPDPRPRGMALLETADRFFDRSGDQLDAFCQTAFPGGDLLILNERQGLLLFPWEDGASPLPGVWDTLSGFWRERQVARFFAAFGTPFSHPRDMAAQLSQLEGLMENAFFLPESAPLFLDAPTERRSGEKDEEQRCIRALEEQAKLRSAPDFRQALSRLTAYYACREQLSSIYVKCVFFRLLHLLMEGRTAEEESLRMEQLARCRSLDELSAALEDAFGKSAPPGPPVPSYSQMVRQILDIIRRDYAKNIGVEYLASCVRRTPGYLNTVFRRETGCNLLKYLNQYRLEKARELLSQPEAKVSAISEALGYSTPSYFIMQFKNHFGMTPGEYSGQFRRTP